MRLLITLCVMIVFGACGRVQGEQKARLSTENQIKAVVLPELVSLAKKQSLLGRKSQVYCVAAQAVPTEDLRYSTTDPDTALVEYLISLDSRFIPASLCRIHEQTREVQFGEDRGWLLWVDSIVFQQDGEAVVSATYYEGVLSAAGLNCQVERRESLWRLRKCDMDWVS